MSDHHRLAWHVSSFALLIVFASWTGGVLDEQSPGLPQSTAAYTDGLAVGRYRLVSGKREEPGGALFRGEPAPRSDIAPGIDADTGDLEDDATPFFFYPTDRGTDTPPGWFQRYSEAFDSSDTGVSEEPARHTLLPVLSSHRDPFVPPIPFRSRIGRKES